MKSNYLIILYVGLSFLVCTSISCLKPVELEVSPQSDYMVYGLISNTLSELTIVDIDNNESQIITNAKVYIEVQGQRIDFKTGAENYVLENYNIPPSTPYSLVVEIGNKKTVIQGQLPDTVNKAELNLEKIKDFQYDIKLTIESNNTDDSYGYLYYPYEDAPLSQNSLSPPYGGYENEYLDYLRNESFVGYKSNPLLYNKAYQIGLYRVYAKDIDASYVLLDFFENRDNPLYVAYNPKTDILKDNILFRVVERLKIKTNVVRIKDTTPILLKLNLTTLNGEAINVAQLKERRIIGYFQDMLNSRAEFNTEVQAPLEFSLNQLAQLLRPDGNNELDLNDLLNREINIYIQGVDSSGRTVGATAIFSLSSLSETIDMTAILGR